MSSRQGPGCGDVAMADYEALVAQRDRLAKAANFALVRYESCSEHNILANSMYRLMIVTLMPEDIEFMRKELLDIKGL